MIVTDWRMLCVSDSMPWRVYLQICSQRFCLSFFTYQISRPSNLVSAIYTPFIS